MKIGSIVIRCYEFEKMLAFWQEALHYVPRSLQPTLRGFGYAGNLTRTKKAVGAERVGCTSSVTTTLGFSEFRKSGTGSQTGNSSERSGSLKVLISGMRMAIIDRKGSEWPNFRW